MPDGNLGGGLGTQVNPFEVWDINDLVALRGKPTSPTSRVYVKFKADINFAETYPINFDTIRFGANTSSTTAWDYVDIDGEGHTLYNFRQSGTSTTASVGLFRYLSGEFKNLTFQNCDLRGNVSGIRAVFIQNCSTQLIENIKIFGEMTNTSNSSSNFMTGLGNVSYNSGSSSNPVVINDCVVSLKVLTDSQFYGFLIRESITNFQFNNCISACDISYYQYNNGQCAGFWGLGSGTVNDTGSYQLTNCISDCKFTAPYYYDSYDEEWYGGVFRNTVSGFRSRASGSNPSTANLTFTNCISKCHFKGKPPSTTDNIAAFSPTSIAATNTKGCYSICTYDLNDDVTTNIRGGDGGILFDYENSGLLPSRFTDVASWGSTTAQMKSESYLTGTRGWVFDQTGYKIDATGVIWNGYPYVHVYATPPRKNSNNLNSVIGYTEVGLSSLDVTFANTENLINGDKLTIQLLNNMGTDILYQEEKLLLKADSGMDITVSIDKSDLENLALGVYPIRVFILRGTEEYIPHLFKYFLYEKIIELSNVTPITINKPVTTSNNTVAFNYQIFGDDIGKIKNTFKIGDYTKTKECNETLSIVASTSASTMTLNFIFNVTEPNFKLISFKFYMRAASTAWHSYSIDGERVVLTDEGVIPEGWREYVFPVPLLLSVGSHTITSSVGSSASGLYFSTTTKPTAPGMTITSTTVYRMEMNYSIPSSFKGSETIVVNNSIQPNVYPIVVDSEAIINGSTMLLTTTTNHLVTVVKGLITIGDIVLAVPKRYTQCGVDNLVTVTNMQDTLPGDIISIKIFWSTTSYYTYTETLTSSITSYAHTIPAAIWNTLTTAREYTVSVSIERGDYKDEDFVPYTVIARPTISYRNITATQFNIPLTSPTALTLGLRVSAEISRIEGEGTLVDAAYSSTVTATSIPISLDASISNPFDFDVTFVDISALDGGYYNVRYSIDIVHDIYGRFTITNNNIKNFTISDPNNPGLTSVVLNYPMRYVGAPINVNVSTRTYGMLAGGDQLLYELKDGDTVLYSYTTANLSANTISNAHSIPSVNFANLNIGIYTISVTAIRNGTNRKTINVFYEAVKPPTLHFVGLEPNRINLPIESPLDIIASFYINGKDVDSIQGEFEIIGTSLVVNVNRTL